MLAIGDPWTPGLLEWTGGEAERLLSLGGGVLAIGVSMRAERLLRGGV